MCGRELKRNQPAIPSPNETPVMWWTNMLTAMDTPPHTDSFQLPVRSDRCSRMNPMSANGNDIRDVNQPHKMMELRTG